MKLKVISDGKRVWGDKIVNAETGDVLEGVTKYSIHSMKDGSTRLYLEIWLPEFDMTMEYGELSGIEKFIEERLAELRRFKECRPKPSPSVPCNQAKTFWGREFLCRLHKGHEETIKVPHEFTLIAWDYELDEMQQSPKRERLL